MAVDGWCDAAFAMHICMAPDGESACVSDSTEALRQRRRNASADSQQTELRLASLRASAGTLLAPARRFGDGTPEVIRSGGGTPAVMNQEGADRRTIRDFSEAPSQAYSVEGEQRGVAVVCAFAGAGTAAAGLGTLAAVGAFADVPGGLIGAATGSLIGVLLDAGTGAAIGNAVESIFWRNRGPKRHL